LCLEDYINILKFQGNYKLEEKEEHKKIKACFWKGVANVLNGNYK
jgi:hypothetical protein